MAAIIGLISGIFTILKESISFLYRKLRAPIKLSPKQIGIGLQPWNIKTSFHIQNRTEEVLFDVWIKLCVENCDLKTNNIKIHSGDGKAFLSAKISTISINYDFVRMDGVDKDSNGCIFFILYRLVPNIPQPFTIEVISVGEREKNGNPRISLRVIRYSKTPVKLLLQNNVVAYPFTPPENFTIKSLHLLMNKV